MKIIYALVTQLVFIAISEELPTEPKEPVPNIQDPAEPGMEVGVAAKASDATAAAAGDATAGAAAAATNDSSAAAATSAADEVSTTASPATSASTVDVSEAASVTSAAVTDADAAAVSGAADAAAASAAGGATATASATAGTKGCAGNFPSALNEFSFDLFKNVSKDTKSNVFLSTLALSATLSMIAYGAKGETVKQIEKVMLYEKYLLTNMGASKEFSAVLGQLTQEGEDYKLLLANDIFLEERHTPLPAYIKDLQQYYMASVQPMDFFNEEESSAINEINIFVADKTEVMVPKLFDKPLGKDSQMVVVSVVYFKGSWKNPFPKDKTAEQDFHLSGGSKKKVKMMSQHQQTFRFLDDTSNNYKFLELPYKWDELALLLAMPKKVDEELDLLIHADFLCQVNSSMTSTLMAEVKVPRFRVQFLLPMEKVLQSMGVKDVFDKDKADMTGISEKKGLFVSHLVHKVVLDVDEEGTRAAAETAVAAAMASSVSPKAGPSFVADHPFFLYIVDKRNGMILFTGRIMDPSNLPVKS